MPKVDPLDSGGFEAPAIPGEDFGEALSVLQWGLEVPTSGAVARLYRSSPHRLAQAGVLTAGGVCLLNAWNLADPRLALLSVALTVWGLTFVTRARRMEAEESRYRQDALRAGVRVEVPVLVSATCRVCRQPFLVEPGRGSKASSRPGKEGPPRGEVDLCSRACSETWFNRLAQAGPAAPMSPRRSPNGSRT